MTRKNTISWQDCITLNKKCQELQAELMKWQMYTNNPDPDNPGMLLPIHLVKDNGFRGDSNVICAIIELKQTIDKALERHKKFNS